MFTILARKSFVLAVFGLLTVALLPGCAHEATAEEFCRKCGADSKTVETCVKETIKEQEDFKQIGCDSEFQGFLDCIVDDATCTADGRVSEDSCTSDRIATLNCLGGL